MAKTDSHGWQVAEGRNLMEDVGRELPNDHGDVVAEYEAAHRGAVLSDTSAAGILYLEGRDRADLLHRISTNDVASLTAGQGAVTILTTPTARIIERLTIYAEPERIVALTAPGNSAKVLNYLQRNIFFMDQVTVSDASAELGLLTVFGPQAAVILSQVTTSDIGSLTLHQHFTAAIGGVAIRIARTDAIIGDGFHLLCPREALPDLWTALVEEGARPIGLEAVEALRVEAGVPALNHELSSETTPVDVGLLDDISFTKGCYTGQEVIARMVNYDKIPKGLYGLRLASSTGLTPPAIVEVDGKRAGEMTSIARSPVHGTIALAVLRRVQVPAGTQAQVIADGERIAAEVVALPFAGKD